MQPRCHILLTRAEAFATLAALHESSRTLGDTPCLTGLQDLQDLTALLIGKLYPEDGDDD